MRNMINTPYGPLLERDEAHDLIVDRLRAIDMEYSVRDDVLAIMTDELFRDPELQAGEYSIARMEDSEIAAWAADVAAELDRPEPYLVG